MTTGTPLDREICLMGVSCYIGRSTMKSKFEYSIKRHITFCSYEKLWITLTALMVISVFWMIRGSTAELLIDTKITRFLFWSDENGDKTLYNIAISYFAAYVFYILQVYIPECKKTRRALETTALDAYNLVNQTMLFLFVWDKLTEKTSDGAIMRIKCQKFYFISKLYSDIAHEADIGELKKIASRVKDDYERIIENPYFSMVDENIYTLLRGTNIAEEIKNLLVLTLSANQASKTSATIFETYSPDEVELIKAKMMLIKVLYGFNDVGSFEETTDEQAIQKWEDYKKLTNAIIAENLDFFGNLPEGYSETVK